MIQNWLTVEKTRENSKIFAIFMIAQIKKIDLEALFSEFKNPNGKNFDFDLSLC